MPARPALRYRPLLGSGGGSGGGGWMEVAPSNTGSGPGPFTQYRVTLRGLAAGAQYEYAVGWLSANSTGSSSSWPLASRLAVPSAAPSYLPSFAFFGDLGWTDNQILPLLGEECAAGGLDAVVLFGDMVYVRSRLFSSASTYARGRPHARRRFAHDVSEADDHVVNALPAFIHHSSSACLPISFLYTCANQLLGQRRE
jgi:hypothetical protein